MALHVESELFIHQLPMECVQDCSDMGDVSPAVEYWRQNLDFTVDRERAILCLGGYGAWEDLDEADNDTLAERILWLACGSFSEWDGTEDSACGSDVFCLE